MFDLLKTQIVEICHYMHAQGFVAGTDGNFSVRVASGDFLMTPSGVNKGLICEEDILLINNKGKIIEGSGKVSTETKMHLKVYQLRDDVSCVIHAHPPYVVAHNVAGIDLSARILPETVLLFKEIITTDYSRPCSDDNVKLIEKHIKGTDVLILRRHGTLTVGKDIMSSYNKLEKLEHTAKVAYIANSLSSVKLLDEDECCKLINLRKELKIR